KRRGLPAHHRAEEGQAEPSTSGKPQGVATAPGWSAGDENAVNPDPTPSTPAPRPAQQGDAETPPATTASDAPRAQALSSHGRTPPARQPLRRCSIRPDAACSTR